jgi:hypothetical protein
MRSKFLHHMVRLALDLSTCDSVPAPAPASGPFVFVYALISSTDEQIIAQDVSFFSLSHMAVTNSHSSGFLDVSAEFHLDGCPKMFISLSRAGDVTISSADQSSAESSKLRVLSTITAKAAESSSSMLPALTAAGDAARLIFLRGDLCLECF